MPGVVARVDGWKAFYRKGLRRRGVGEVTARQGRNFPAVCKTEGAPSFYLVKGPGRSGRSPKVAADAVGQAVRRRRGRPTTVMS